MLRKLIRIIFSENAIVPWMMIVAIIPMIIISLFSYSIARNNLQININNTLKVSLQKKVETIDDYVSERKFDLLQLCELPYLLQVIDRVTENDHVGVISRQDMQPIVNYLQHLTDIFGITNLYIVNLQGQVIYNLNNDALLGMTLSETDPATAELYRVFMGAQILQANYVTQVTLKNSTIKPSLLMSNPIMTDAGVPKAVMIIQFNPAFISGVISRTIGYIKAEDSILAGLINNEVTVFISNLQNPINKNDDPQLFDLLRKAIKGEMNVTAEIVTNGQKKIVVYSYVPQLNMGLLVAYNKSEVFASLDWLRMNIFILLAIGLLLVGLVVSWISSQLRQANIASELLLENILPKFVIHELKDKKFFKARNCYNVSIIFADIVNFTHFASVKSPESVVHMLDKIFSRFDELTEQYQLEKIKTIGDAFMAASGLIASQQDHADRAVALGVEMILAVKHYNVDHGTHFGLRVGIDSGTVTTGIIGRKKFSYDLWGNAVNCASRMESTGIENQVQITENTYNALQNKERYILSKRESVMVKGIGKLNTYLIEGYAELPEDQTNL